NDEERQAPCLVDLESERVVHLRPSEFGYSASSAYVYPFKGSVRFSPDGRSVAHAVGRQSDRFFALIITDLATGTERSVRVKYFPRSFALTPDGRTAAVVTVYGRESLHAVQLVDLTAGIERWSQVVSFAAWCCFAPDGRTVAIVRALPFQPPLGPVQLRDMPAGSLLADPTTESVVGWTADAHLLVVRDGGIRRLDGRTGEDRGGVPDLGWED